MKTLQPTDLEDAPWYLLQCRPNQTHIASRNLQRLGIDLFVPQQRVTRRWRSRLREELQPLFAGYVFVTFDPRQPAWREIGRTPGVLRLVRFGTGYPTRVPSSLVTALMLRCDEGGVLRPPEDLAPGDSVRLVAGPFADFVARVEKVAPDRRVTLLLELMGRAARLTVDPEQLSRQ